MAQGDLEQVQQAADDVRIGQRRFNLPTEVARHRQLSDRDRGRRINSPTGAISALLPPPVISGYEFPVGAVPQLGEYTDSVLAGLDYCSDEIDDLHSAALIGPTTDSSATR
ncbi:hypothetical protein [Mycobacterium sp. 94-17]|uniref:hypothetical protein n=1 Tax=Mycobacterium sp. 94-17 TaxID=2986147 RepID=UPI002D1F5F02|nr:hypothetical protein [Mycobacterium sp. 94-17]MEB4209740.1 hypothetical protein [Mycobacterium sp. 94-17]